MVDRWYRNAVIYCLDVETFQDSDGDGIGDFAGPDQPARLPRPARRHLPVAEPDPPDPDRDDGYDITDYYGVDPRLGTLGRLRRAAPPGRRPRASGCIIDLVVNHTSDEHPWFHRPRARPDSPYRDWYVWSRRRSRRTARQGMVFPGEQNETWTYDDEAGAWYYHRFYDFQPDLNMANPRVRDEIEQDHRRSGCSSGVAGFRIDAAPFVIELTEPDDPSRRATATSLARRAARAAVSGAAATPSCSARPTSTPSELLEYFGDATVDDRLHMLFDFMLNQRTAAWRWPARSAEPIAEALAETPDAAATTASGRRSCATTTSSTSAGSPTSERDEVFAAFGPDPDMQLYGRGIRRRLAPMLGGDRRRHRAGLRACSSRCRARRCSATATRSAWARTSPCPSRDAIRTPMQWIATRQRRLLHRRRERDLRRPGHRRTATFGYAARQRRPTSGATPTRCWRGSSGCCTPCASARRSAWAGTPR